ncbi:hypothetical protein RB620_23850 [Paenibacillus sp. LHD-117]|uniref:glycosyltransferase family 2 protein n=1 Tax=Paenibacillus sp. LHD-117 TaxID=3071412 RepID=UPI0027DFCDBD|nr:hypothetical protein [Paenibacillus sp. LHD-117]MDQ6422469.1 hypothetical protein [Paenibacillus sp. LHD-117]
MDRELTARLSARASNLIERGMLPPPMNERVTVIVRSTRARWTKLCIYALCQNTKQTIHVIVVPDHTEELTSIDEPHTVSVQYLAPEPGLDLSNLALSMAESSLFVMMEDRVIVTPDWLSKLLWPFYEDSTIALTGPVTSKHHPTAAGQAESLNRLYHISKELSSEYAGVWTYEPMLDWTCLVCRANLISEIGGLDYACPTGEARVTNWIIRAIDHNWKLALCRDTYLHAMQAREPGTTINREPVMRENSKDLFIPLTKAALSPPLMTLIVNLPNFSCDQLNRIILELTKQNYPSIELVVISRLPDSGFIAEKNDSPFPVHFIGLAGNPHSPKAYAAAWALANGKYISYWNPDTIYDSDYFGTLLDRVHKRRSLIAFYDDKGSHVPKNKKQQIPLKRLIHLHPNENDTPYVVHIAQDEAYLSIDGWKDNQMNRIERILPYETDYHLS